METVKSLNLRPKQSPVTRRALAFTLAIATAFSAFAPMSLFSQTSAGSTKTATKSKKKAGATASSSKKKPASKSTKAAAAKKRKYASKPTPQSIRLSSAFVASANLRPMAQQLAATRSAAAYAGVQNYAAAHPGEGAAAAYLALGHAYAQDHRATDAAAMFRRADAAGKALDDYADYLGAQASLQANRPADAYTLLDHFADRHPDSIFVATAPILLANAYLQSGDPQGALRTLQPLAQTPVGTKADFRYVLARAYQLSGNAAVASDIYRKLYSQLPLSSEAQQSRSQLQSMGQPLTAGERKSHADQLFNAKRYTEAGDEYHEIAKNSSSLSTADLNALKIYEAVCDLKLKHLSRRDVEHLPDTGDDTAALKLYMLAEISRNENDATGHDAIINDMVKRFPASRWLEEALYSGGNMYLLKHNSQQAIFHYTTLVTLFPRSTYAPSAHWRAAWMNYRIRNYSEAARLMDEQIQQYGGGIEIPSALYWRGRIYEDEEHNFGQAANYYRALNATYTNYYYAILARQRLAVIGNKDKVEPSPVLASVHPTDVPDLSPELPEDDIHLIKARLLANASLNEFIGPEIAASPDSPEWGALAQAEIYTSFGEVTRALQSMKHSGLPYFALPIDQVPVIYWQLLFPKPYWADLVTDSQRNGVDPYLVASLIRQESEFNAGAVSRANAYGLMQLLPSVGKAAAKKNGIKRFSTNDLLNPATNLLLGTTNLKQVLDRFGGQAEYALAAYNAGDTPVRLWLSSNDYKDVPEFVESIPYTETREYVQAILRNREMYRALYPIR
ncbi:lytic transglycosylase domain-containing protein [Granulicella aggregans]|uniref:lytic transglycosylase domain-containing protein n=1 Tax=Granulicella aggregans TaxID=474949 RepID=UPI0021E0F83F|nr:transglycosylase SLT domain-containing protein [Granulicella aggregans]